MSVRRTISLTLAATVALCLATPSATPVIAAPVAARTAVDRVALERAVESYDDAKARFAQAQDDAAAASAKLDRIILEESIARDRLGKWVLTMYRAEGLTFISVLLEASTFDEFIARWELVTRIAQQDADTLEELRAARLEAELTAVKLLELQEAELSATDRLAGEVARAEKELAASEAALREYQARIAVDSSPAVTDQTQQLTGFGSWRTAVASHYGIDFTGRGASGEAIGPYSMIVAHKTLPFGTLVEFEYNGKRAVAKVADRGPYTAGREFDLGPGVIRVLDFRGVHEVRYRIITD